VSEQDLLRRAIEAAIAQFDRQIETLTRSFDDIVEASELVNTDDEHDPDGATVAFERSQVAALLRQARDDRQALVEAASRIDADGFGLCEVCGEPIGIERLLALPWVRRCVRCAG
jgi:RNA polymerase-binding transcription factor DksA